jgi:L-lactate permease
MAAQRQASSPPFSRWYSKNTGSGRWYAQRFKRRDAPQCDGRSQKQERHPGAYHLPEPVFLMPFLFLTATVTLWSIPPFKALFAKGGALADWVLNVAVRNRNGIQARTTCPSRYFCCTTG